MEKLIPSVIVAAMAAAMVLMVRFLVSKKLDRTTLIVALTVALVTCLAAFWVLSPGH